MNYSNSDYFRECFIKLYLFVLGNMIQKELWVTGGLGHVLCPSLQAGRAMKSDAWIAATWIATAIVNVIVSKALLNTSF